MKTVSGIILALPTVFFVLIFIYNPLDVWWMPTVFASLSLLSALGCLVWACFIRRRSRPLAWACLGVGAIYIVLLVVVPLLMPAPKTRRGGAELDTVNGATPVLLSVERSRCTLPDLVRSELVAAL